MCTNKGITFYICRYANWIMSHVSIPQNTNNMYIIYSSYMMYVLCIALYSYNMNQIPWHESPSLHKFSTWKTAWDQVTKLAGPSEPTQPSRQGRPPQQRLFDLPNCHQRTAAREFQPVAPVVEVYPFWKKVKDTRFKRDFTKQDWK